MQAGRDDIEFDRLVNFIARIPSVETNHGPSKGFSYGRMTEGGWSVNFSLDISNPLAWNVVQGLAFVLNYISITERLPTIFKPVSPPPYLNGGPQDFLSWVIECYDSSFSPTDLAVILENRLPNPVERQESWAVDSE